MNRVLECKYKIEQSDLWEGEPYCSLFNEKCEDLGFICDKNCQVYEDYKQLEYLKKKLLRKESVVEFASCPSYGYSDNTIEATCSKIFCYDVNSCEHKTMVNYEQTLIKLREIAEECMQQDICATCDNSDKCHIEDEEIPTYDVCRIILQKIDEVLYVENN